MNDNSQFSEREKEVTELLLQGKSNKQIALALGVSASTVEYHLKNIYKKLRVNSRTEAVLRLGKSIGSNITGESGKSTVEINGETTDNDHQTISTRRNPMNKSLVLIGGGLLTVALVCVLVFLLTFVNVPVQNMTISPTNALSLPDLIITSAYVSMVDNNLICLPYYGFNVTVVNQGNAPALDVVLADNTGQEVGVGNLNPLQRTSMSFVAHAKNGTYTVVADPHNIIAESDENNNTAIFSQATATPIASCLPMQFGDSTPTPVPTSIPLQVWSTATPQVMSEANPVLTIVPAVNPGSGEDEWTTFVMDRPWYTKKGFRLHYPQSWELTVRIWKADDGSVEAMGLDLEKSGYAIEIGQGAGSEGPCIYPGETTTRQFYGRYGEYKEFDKGNQVYWRRAMPEQQSPKRPLFKVCELRPSADIAVPFTTIGWIELNGPSIDESILREFDEILEKIEIIE